MAENRAYPPLYLGTEYQDGFSPKQSFYPTLGSRALSAGRSGHYGYPRFNIPNVGGPFALTGTEIVPSLQNVGEVWRGGANNQRYVGSFAAAHILPNQPVSQVDGSSLAVQAYNRMKPTKPFMQGLNSIYELRELPDMLRTRFLSQGLKAIPNYWVALKFGWEPLLRDIRDVVFRQRDMQKRLAWLLRHNGKPVRRRVELAQFENPAVITKQHSSGFATNWLYPTVVSQYMSGGLDQTVKQVSGERWWASARFRYWLPDGPKDVHWKRAMFARLYGLYPSPSVIYNAIPWSWMTDWFTHAGSVIENLETGVSNRLAADYLYVMRHSWARCDVNVKTLMSDRNSNPVTIDVSTSSHKFSKTRVAGDPFNLPSGQQPNLTAMQWSILGALGLSKL